MGIRDRLADNAARNQAAMPVSSAVGVVTSAIAAVAMLAIAVLAFARGSIGIGLFFLAIWLMALGNLWLRHAGRQRRRGR